VQHDLGEHRRQAPVLGDGRGHLAVVDAEGLALELREVERAVAAGA
jgi:hypothetical protein